MSLCFRSFEKEIQNKKAEEAVLQSEKRYHTLRRYPGIFYGCCRILPLVNPSWCQISGQISRSFREWLA
jgi:hypothetical protein